MPEKYVGTKPLSPQYSTVSLLALEATKTGGGGAPYGARTTPPPPPAPSPPPPAAAPRGASLAVPAGRAVARGRVLHAPLDAALVGVGDLPAALGPREAV